MRERRTDALSGGAEAAASSAFNRLAGRVLRVVPTGAYLRVTVDCGFPLVALMTRRSIEEMELRDGAPVTAHFKSTAPHLMRHGK